jgi:hypothetical protein
MQVNADLEELCRVVCPACRGGVPLRYRTETSEWVHDKSTKTNFSHSICWATGLRKKYQTNG